jgi:hypothetical protein
MLVELIINGKTLTFSHKNDFDNGNIHYLFGDGTFLYWIDTTNDIVTGIASTLRQEAETWEWWGEPFPEEKFKEHEAFEIVLNEYENMLKFQNILFKCW